MRSRDSTAPVDPKINRYRNRKSVPCAKEATDDREAAVDVQAKLNCSPHYFSLAFFLIFCFLPVKLQLRGLGFPLSVSQIVGKDTNETTRYGGEQKVKRISYPEKEN